jgi:hypothetical protein
MSSQTWTFERADLTLAAQLASLSAVKDGASIFSHMLASPDADGNAVVNWISTDQRTFVRTPVRALTSPENPSKFTIEVDSFLKWVSQMTADSVELTVLPDSVQAKCGKAKSFFRTMKPENFPIPTRDVTKQIAVVNAYGFSQLLDTVRHGLPDGGTGVEAEMFKIVRFKQMSAVATDNHKCVYMHTTSLKMDGALDDPNLDLKVGGNEAAPLMQYLKKVGQASVKIQRDKSRIFVEAADGSAFGFTEPNADHVQDPRQYISFSTENAAYLLNVEIKEIAHALKTISASASATSKDVTCNLDRAQEILRLSREGTSSRSLNEDYAPCKIDRAQDDLAFKLNVDTIARITSVFSGTITLVLSPNESRGSILVTVMQSDKDDSMRVLLAQGFLVKS